MVGDLNVILCISKRGPVFVPMLIAGTTGKKHIITRPQPAVCIGGGPLPLIWVNTKSAKPTITCGTLDQVLE